MSEFSTQLEEAEVRRTEFYLKSICQLLNLPLEAQEDELFLTNFCACPLSIYFLGRIHQFLSEEKLIQPSNKEISESQNRNDSVDVVSLSNFGAPKKNPNRRNRKRKRGIQNKDSNMTMKFDTYPYPVQPIIFPTPAAEDLDPLSDTSSKVNRSNIGFCVPTLDRFGNMVSEPDLEFKSPTSNVSVTVTQKQFPDVNNPFECAMCDSAFETVYLRKLHILEFHQAKPYNGRSQLYQCKYGDYMSRDLENLQAHLGVHRREDSLFQCTECSCTFQSEAQLLYHEKNFIHARQSYYKCSACSLSFRYLTEMEDHSMVHKGKHKNFGLKCEHRDCKDDWVNYKNEADFKEHRELMHPAEVLDPVQPTANPISGETTEFPLRLSTQKTENFSNSTVECAMCYTNFSTLKEREDHNTKSHCNEPYKCKYCGRQFMNSSNLYTHMNVHIGGKKPFQCEDCGGYFQTELLLVNHGRNVHSLSYTLENTNPNQPLKFKCENCSSCFKYRTEMDQHSQIHVQNIKIQTDTSEEKQKAESGHLEDNNCAFLPLQSKVEYQDEEIPETTQLSDEGCVCTLCQIQFPSVIELTEHLMTHAPSGVAVNGFRFQIPYICGTCDLKFEDMKFLQAHLATHNQSSELTHK